MDKHSKQLKKILINYLDSSVCPECGNELSCNSAIQNSWNTLFFKCENKLLFKNSNFNHFEASLFKNLSSKQYIGHCIRTIEINNKLFIFEKNLENNTSTIRYFDINNIKYINLPIDLIMLPSEKLIKKFNKLLILI